MNSVLKYNTLVVDPNIETRMRLKQACSSVATFGKYIQVGTADEGLFKLKQEESIEVVFVSNKLERDALSEFIKNGKLTKWGQDAAFITVLSAKDQDSSSVAQNVMIGADGVLFEPYSVDSLVDITVLAAKVKKERQDLRADAAMKFIITEIAEQLSVVAQFQAQAFDTSRHLKKLRELCAVIKTFDESANERYFRLVMDVFENAPIPPPVSATIYRGASSRIRKRVEDKVIAEIKKSTDLV